MAGPRAEVIIDGDVGPLRKSLREGVSAMNQFNQQAGSQIGGLIGPMEGMAAKFAALVGVIAGGAVFRQAIEETVQFNREVQSLSRTLGISTTDATAWNIALGDIYLDSEALVGALGKLNRVISEDEEKLNSLGIATRDATGQLRSQADILLSVTGYLAKFKEGTDRNVEGARIFGKSWSEVAPILKLTADNIGDANDKAQELGLTMTAESQGTVTQYRASMNDVGDVMLGLKNAIALAVMPVLTRLGEWFSSIGPTAILVTKGAIGGLATAFMGLQNGVVVLWEVFKAFVYSVTEPIVSLGKAFVQLAQGDFKGASELMMDWPSRIGQRWTETFASIAESSRRTANDISALWGPGSPTSAVSAGDSAAPPPGKTGNNKPAAAPSRMAELEAMLAKEKQALIESGLIREYEAQQELDFWKRKSQMADLNGQDRLKVERKVAQLSYEVRKQAIDQGRQLDEQDRTQAAALAMSKLETEIAGAQVLLDNDAITKAQFLQMQIGFEQRKYEIERAAMEQRLALLAMDPNGNPVEAARVQGELLLLQEKFQRERLNTLGQMEKEGSATGIFKGMESSFAQGFESVLTGAKTMSSALLGIFKDIGMSFIRHVVTEPVAKFIAGESAKLAASLGFISQETAARIAGSTVTTTAKETETGTVVANNAAQAGSAAAASQAGIPFAGPVLALAAMAAVFAAVSALKPKASAAGGYDIPSGVNPLTQLHEEEMVLPKHLANPMRDMLAGGGMGGGGGDNINITVQAVDARGVAQFFRGAGGDAMVREMSMRKRSNRAGG